MNFLVGRCAGRRLTQWLQSQGHNALDARELGPDPGYRALLERAVSEDRILITMDKDFGELIHLHGRPHTGLIRLPEVEHGPENHPCGRPNPQPPPSPRRTGDHNRNERQNPHLKTAATITTNNNLDALFADAGLPFGHPGQRFDDTPEYFDHSPLLDQRPEPDYTPDEDGAVVHYAPGDRPLCGDDSMTAIYTDDPAVVARCTV